MPKLSDNTKLAIWEFATPLIGLAVAFLLFMASYAIPFLKNIAGFVVIISLFSIPVMILAGLRTLFYTKK